MCFPHNFVSSPSLFFDSTRTQKNGVFSSTVLGTKKPRTPLEPQQNSASDRPINFFQQVFNFWRNPDLFGFLFWSGIWPQVQEGNFWILHIIGKNLQIPNLTFKIPLSAPNYQFLTFFVSWKMAASIWRVFIYENYQLFLTEKCRKESRSHWLDWWWCSRSLSCVCVIIASKRLSCSSHLSQSKLSCWSTGAEWLRNGRQPDLIFAQLEAFNSNLRSRRLQNQNK